MDFPGLADKSAVKSKQIIVFCNKPSTIPMVRVYIFIRKAYTEKPLLPVQKNQDFCRNRKNNYENDEIPFVVNVSKEDEAECPFVVNSKKNIVSSNESRCEITMVISGPMSVLFEANKEINALCDAKGLKHEVTNKKKIQAIRPAVNELIS